MTHTEKDSEIIQVLRAMSKHVGKGGLMSDIIMSGIVNWEAIKNYKDSEGNECKIVMPICQNDKDFLMGTSPFERFQEDIGEEGLK